MILAASRKKAICFSLSCNAEAIYDAIQELYEDLGGITLELIIDNPKSLVVENDPKSEDEIKYNEQSLLLSRNLMHVIAIGLKPKEKLKSHFNT